MDTQSDNEYATAGTPGHFVRYLMLILLMTLLVVIPAAITLQTVQMPAERVFHKELRPDPSPLGYTASLTFFLLPSLVLLRWFRRHPHCRIEWKAFRYTLGVLSSIGFALDVCLGNQFFKFPNSNAICGIKWPGLEQGRLEWRSIPIEEFGFYFFGFLAILLMYIWCDHYWCARYNVPDYREPCLRIKKFVEPFYASLIFALVLIVGACWLRQYEGGTGLPGYFTFLVFVALVPAFFLFRTAAPFINWRAFGFSLAILPLVSVIWEVTLGIPYGWWDFRKCALIGTRIIGWFELPIEEPILWLCTTWTTVIVFETFKIRFYSKSANLSMDETPVPVIPEIDPNRGCRTVVLMMIVLILPTILTLSTVQDPLRRVSAENPSPLGYTWSLTLFLVPLIALALGARRYLGGCETKALVVTAVAISLIGFILDFFFAAFFFDFDGNRGATLGYRVRGVIPIEEFLFYIFGGLAVLLTYIWGDMYWLSEYNVPDYHGESQKIRRALGFHRVALAIGAVGVALAILYKAYWPHPYQQGWPGYFVFLTVIAFFPTIALFQAVKPFINWQAFSFAFFLLLLISLLWEATLAIPYRWWEYQEEQMIGIMIKPWASLPIEAVFVWLVTAWTTVSFYEFLKILFYSKRSYRDFLLGSPPPA